MNGPPRPTTPWTCPACCRTESGGRSAHTRCPRGNAQDDSDDRPAPVHPSPENPARSLPSRNRRSSALPNRPGGSCDTADDSTSAIGIGCGPVPSSAIPRVPPPAGHGKALAGASTPPGRDQQSFELSQGASGMFILPCNPEPVPMGSAVIHSLWKPRLYPGTLATTSRVRADLRRDLTSTPALPELPGPDPDLVDSIVLCASEMFANACEHTRSGEDGGRVVRTLTRTDERTLRLSVIDDGYRDADTRPRIPHQRTAQDWKEAERGRGLLLIHHLAARWGTRRVVGFPFCEGLGTVLWADFDLFGNPAVLSTASASASSTTAAPEAVR